MMTTRRRPTDHRPPLSTHLDDRGEVHMVDVGDKAVTRRRAVAAGAVRMSEETAARLARGDTPKGEVLATARLAGIMAAKRTSDLIPLCHPLPLTRVTVDLKVDEAGVEVVALAECEGKTGVEMEALTAVSVACLTLYDMLKGIDRSMEIGAVRLLEKSGGQRGAWRREPAR